MEFHEKLRHLREHLKDWTQAEVAEKLHVDTNTYGCIERGETQPNLRRLQQIAKVFGIKLEELVSEKSVSNVGVDNSNNGNHFFSNCCNTSSSEQLVELQHELEKIRLLLEQKDKEIDYLKQQNADLREMVGLLKK
jgi:transcriptional regulator with XRE-family HTH domain